MAITEYIRNADRAILKKIFEITFRRVNKCLETGGGHFEHYLYLSVLKASGALKLLITLYIKHFYRLITHTTTFFITTLFSRLYAIK
jgi:hypothetical protein